MVVLDVLTLLCTASTRHCSYTEPDYGLAQGRAVFSLQPVSNASPGSAAPVCIPNFLLRSLVIMLCLVTRACVKRNYC